MAAALWGEGGVLHITAVCQLCPPSWDTRKCVQTLCHAPSGAEAALADNLPGMTLKTALCTQAFRLHCGLTSFPGTGIGARFLSTSFSILTSLGGVSPNRPASLKGLPRR